MATIEARKNKKGQVTSYRIKVYRGYDDKGTKLKPYILTYKPDPYMSEKQVKKELERMAIEFENKCEYGGAVVGTSMKLTEFIPKYLETMKDTLSPYTFQFYSNIIYTLIIPAFQGMKLVDIRTVHVQSFIQQIARMPKSSRDGSLNNRERIAPATVRRYLTVLQSILKLAVKLGYIPDTPAKADKLTLPKMVQPKIEIFTKAEAAEMLECLEKEDLQFQILVQLAIYLGARRGELVALKFSDIDFDSGKVTIERAAVKVKGEKAKIKPPKDYEVRTVTVNPASLELLKKLKEEKIADEKRLGSKWEGDDFIFTQWNGEMMNPMTPTKQFSKFLEKNGLKHRKFHALRHTSATLLLYGGVSLRQVQGRLGHGDIETTNKYLHYIEEADAEAARVLENVLTKPESTRVGRISSVR